ncbi:hypothetical protein GCM10009530_73330 [Microbispora corallina]|uniref:Uncharacterized protein n=1 Tax=Microbispora corallina TaxID=83302 RepID=A0ABQ4GAQ6_9ACTN|nr:hypothetical protein Mco01_71320 [Microbispora corallina]
MGLDRAGDGQGGGPDPMAAGAGAADDATTAAPSIPANATVVPCERLIVPPVSGWGTPTWV